VNSSQKPIRKTALGTWIKRKAPHILDHVGDLLPDQGGLGILERILDKEHLQIMLDPRKELKGKSIWMTTPMPL
jgi:hypothetical protein